MQLDVVETKKVVISLVIVRDSTHLRGTEVDIVVPKKEGDKDAREEQEECTGEEGHRLLRGGLQHQF